jgi:NAD(P)-dependent dehydrogenase (short-subunit alcohol dehydrogenase family)
VPLPEPPAPGRPMLPADTFAGSVVVVTGGGTGLGRAIAVEFARAGAAVGIVSRAAEHRRAGVEAVTAAGGRAAEAEADVRRPDEVSAAFEAVEEALGRVRLLVNNAAANFPVPAEDLSPGGWRAVTQIVLDGTFFCSQELFRRAHAAGEPAAICNVLATQAFTGGPGMAHSAAAKAAVENLTKTLAVEWAPHGVRVNALAPGLFVHQDMRRELTVLRPGGEELDARRSPAGRLGRAHELGWAATWLCSPYASFVTGHTLVVDGGNWLRRHFVMPEFVPVRTQIAEALRPRGEGPPPRSRPEAAPGAPPPGRRQHGGT